MTSATTATPPTVTETYYPGATLSLYSSPPPIPPAKGNPQYKGLPLLPRVEDRYNKSIEEQMTSPPTSPDVTITLEKSFNSGKRHIAYVWLVQTQDSSSTQIHYPSMLVAKIYDVVWYTESELYEPFKARDLLVSREVESYRRFQPIQGTKVPRFYGHYVAPIPSQQNRIVHVILMQYIPCNNLRQIIHRNRDAVCDAHRDAVHEAIANLTMDTEALGVHLLDLYPRNVLLLPPKEHREYCASPECPLRLAADWKNLELVLIDFDAVRFIEPFQYSDAERKEEMASLRHDLSGWVECCNK